MADFRYMTPDLVAARQARVVELWKALHERIRDQEELIQRLHAEVQLLTTLGGVPVTGMIANPAAARTSALSALQAMYGEADRMLAAFPALRDWMRVNGTIPGI